jgi:hypothetical protein
MYDSLSELLFIRMNDIHNMLSINYLSQCRIDKDIFLSGFPEKIATADILPKLAEIGDFNMKEVDYHYSFTMVNTKFKTEQHCAVIGFNNRRTKNELFSKLKLNGPIFVQQICPTFDNPNHGEKKILFQTA